MLRTILRLYLGFYNCTCLSLVKSADEINIEVIPSDKEKPSFDSAAQRIYRLEGLPQSTVLECSAMNSSTISLSYLSIRRRERPLPTVHNGQALRADGNQLTVYRRIATRPRKVKNIRLKYKRAQNALSI